MVTIFNSDDIYVVKGASPRQILANVDMQASVGCLVSQSLGVEVGNRKIAKAGTPVQVDFSNLQRVACLPDVVVNTAIDEKIEVILDTIPNPRVTDVYFFNKALFLEKIGTPSNGEPVIFRAGNGQAGNTNGWNNSLNDWAVNSISKWGIRIQENQNVTKKDTDTFTIIYTKAVDGASANVIDKPDQYETGFYYPCVVDSGAFRENFIEVFADGTLQEVQNIIFTWDISKNGWTARVDNEEVQGEVFSKEDLESFGFTYYLDDSVTPSENFAMTIEYTPPKKQSQQTANAVLLHDVDVTEGDANGAALYFGTVNINRLESDVQQRVEAGVNVVGQVSFVYG